MSHMPALKLPFAHEVLSAVFRLHDLGVVLCHLPDNSCTPYATWRVDDHGNCYWGHYARALDDARIHFMARALTIP